jgi:hypothetical protein
MTPQYSTFGGGISFSVRLEFAISSIFLFQALLKCYLIGFGSHHQTTSRARIEQRILSFECIYYGLLNFSSIGFQLFKYSVKSLSVLKNKSFATKARFSLLNPLVSQHFFEDVTHKYVCNDFDLGWRAFILLNSSFGSIIIKCLFLSLKVCITMTQKSAGEFVIFSLFKVHHPHDSKFLCCSFVPWVIKKSLENLTCSETLKLFF